MNYFVSAFMWIKREGLLLLALGAVIYLFQYAVDYPYSNGPFYLYAALLLMAGCVWFVSVRRSRSLDKERAENIRVALMPDLRLVERATDMFWTSQHFQRKASSNNYLSVGILIALAMFLAVPSIVLIGEHSSEIQSLTNIKAAMDRYRGQDNLQTDEYKGLVADFRELNKAQQAIDVAVSAPVYRIATSVFIRISVVGVAIYLVVMMNNAFKYNNAMAAMYRSRLSAVLKGDDNFSDFKEYSKLMDPIDISYDSRIKHPLEQMMGAVRNLTESIAALTPNVISRAPTGNARGPRSKKATKPAEE